jgi:hypothetical protein
MRAMCKLTCIVLLMLIIGSIAIADTKNVNAKKVLIPGIYLEAWNACSGGILKELERNASINKLNQHEIEFSEENDYITIEITPGETSEYIPVGGGMKYWINKKSMIMTKKELYK